MSAFLGFIPGFGEEESNDISNVASHRNIIVSVCLFGPHGLALDLPCLQSHHKMKAMISVSFLWARKVRIDSMLNTLKDTAAF